MRKKIDFNKSKFRIACYDKEGAPVGILAHTGTAATAYDEAFKLFDLFRKDKYSSVCYVIVSNRTNYLYVFQDLRSSCISVNKPFQLNFSAL